MRNLGIFSALLLSGALVSAPAFAVANAHPLRVAQNYTQYNNGDQKQNLANADTLLRKASAVITRMEAVPHVTNLLQRAKGVLIMPDFGRASFIVGGGWGGGVLLEKNHGRWTDPVFFSMGGGSIGLQAGVSGGPVALLIMSDRAMNQFRSGANWSLNAAAGFNVVNYSATTPQASWGKGGDVIVWSGMSGGYAGIRASLTDISVNAAYNDAVYGTTNMRSIVAGRPPLINKLARNVRNKLPVGNATQQG
jgi:lipid-binding SYLF domain-containing protein